MPRGTSLVVGRSRSPAGINHAAVVPDLFGVTDVASALIPGAQLQGYELNEVNTGPRFATTSSSGATSLSGTYDRVLFTADVDFTGPCTFTDCEFQNTIRPLDAAVGTTLEFCAIRTEWANPTIGNIHSLSAPGFTTVEDNQWSPPDDSSNFDLITFYRCRSYGPAGHGAMRLLTGSTVTECLLINRCSTPIMNEWYGPPSNGTGYHSVITTNGGVTDCRWNRCASWLAGIATGHGSLQGNFGSINNAVLTDIYCLNIEPDPNDSEHYYVVQGIPNPSTINNSELNHWLIAPEPYPTLGGATVSDANALYSIDDPQPEVWQVNVPWEFYP